ncbi:PHP domain-containing protein [Paenibacillus alba]|uniref:PHP domain-containing protein n=1 Tax=Paenibacillus alba TaxID=1197127 RepID=UPI00156373DD|nr:PHP domain-containing protein [Paenibacillus alba]NQX67493.1 PHP domain-containing protein [Paenibacillus alba]
MKIDFHTHVKLTKSVMFSYSYFLESIQEARQAGLSATALTEHFNTLRFNDIYETLDQHFAYKQHYYDIDGFKLFPGMEIDVKEGGHILFIACRDTIRELRQQLNGYEAEGQFIGMEALLDMASSYNVLKIGAHPYRADNPLTGIPHASLQQLDALDLNAKDLYKYGIDVMQNKVNALGQTLGIPVVAGSDTHHPLQFGSVWNVMQADCGSIDDLKSCLQAGTYRLEISPCLDTKVKAAETVKRLMKASGGHP